MRTVSSQSQVKESEAPTSVVPVDSFLVSAFREWLPPGPARGDWLIPAWGKGVGTVLGKQAPGGRGILSSTGVEGTVGRVCREMIPELSE